MLEFAINALKIKSIIVCGHYNCGGVHAAMQPEPLSDTMETWLAPIKDVVQKEEPALEKCASYNEKAAHIVEANVKAQVERLLSIPVVQEASNLSIHAWVYDLATGLIHDLNDAPTKA